MSSRDAALPSQLQGYAAPCDDEARAFMETAWQRALQAGEPGASASERVVVAALACPCGETALVLGASFNWEVVDGGCGACGREVGVHDPLRDGRLAGRGAPPYERPPFDATPLGCMCRMMLFSPLVAFAYDGAASSADDYVWLAVGGRCVACGVLNLFFDAACD